MPRSGVDLLREPPWPSDPPRRSVETPKAYRIKPDGRVADRTQVVKFSPVAGAALSICSGDVVRAKIALQVIRPREKPWLLPH